MRKKQKSRKEIRKRQSTRIRANMKDENGKKDKRRKKREVGKKEKKQKKKHEKWSNEEDEMRTGGEREQNKRECCLMEISYATHPIEKGILWCPGTGVYTHSRYRWCAI